MKTNSPNQVDGDVQALIDHINTQLDLIRSVTIKHLDEFQIEDIKMDIKVHEIALAALTAEPVDFRWRWARDENAVWTYCRMDKYQDAINAFADNATFEMVYTTPPAQLLRPVELPKKIERDDADGYWMHKSGRVSAVNAAYFNEAIKECAEALRQQGYEVKE